MIVLKSFREIESMKTACRLSRQALDLAGSLVQPGVTTREIDARVRQFIEAAGGKPSFLGYGGFPGSCCISVNDEVIHGIPGNRKLLAGDIVSIDVGAHINGYHGDNAATYAVSQISEQAQKLIHATEQSLYAAIAAVKPGARMGDIGYAVQSLVEKQGFSVVREYVGHGVGANLHEGPDVPNYGRPGRGLRLETGMTFAIEPMINLVGEGIRVLNDRWTVVTRSGSVSAHFEHTIAVTETGAEILTKI